MQVKWNEIPEVLKTIGMVAVGLTAAIGYVELNFESAEAADLKWASHNMQIACNKVVDLEGQIRELKKKKAKAATEEEKADLQDDIDWIRQRIRDIDPNGDCKGA